MAGNGAQGLMINSGNTTTVQNNRAFGNSGDQYVVNSIAQWATFASNTAGSLTTSTNATPVQTYYASFTLFTDGVNQYAGSADVCSPGETSCINFYIGAGGSPENLQTVSLPDVVDGTNSI